MNKVNEKDLMFYEAVQNALISFYIKVAYQDKIICWVERNKILKGILKLLLNQKKYKLIKRDLKGLVIWEKKTGLSLESKLIEVYELAEKHYVNIEVDSDLIKLFQSLNHINRLCHLKLDAIDFDGKKDDKTLYVVEEDMVCAFNDEGVWLKGKSVRLLVPKEKKNKVVSYFQKTHLSLTIIHSKALSNHMIMILSIN